MFIKNERGFSLVELLVTTAILSVVAIAIFSFMTTSSSFFTRSKKEISIQTSAQETVNWLTKHIVEAGLGVSGQVDGSTGDVTLDIYNSDRIYTVYFDKSEGVIYCDESRFNNTDGSIYRVTNDKENILAEHVTDFTVDLSKADTEEKAVSVSVSMQLTDKETSLHKSLKLRNDIKINEAVSNVYNGVSIIASSVTSVQVIPDEVTAAKGGKEQFSARVIGIGFPSQSVVWSIVDRTGLKDETTIDSKTGLLSIAADETVTAFRVMATAVETDSAGNYVTSTPETGKVKVAAITFVEIGNEPDGKVDVGTSFTLSALVHGENMSGDFQQVKWTIPDGYDYSGLILDSKGKVTLSYKLYDAFPTKAERDNAKIKIRATSVKDSSKYDECEIGLKFSDVSINFDDLTIEANRNGTLNLSEKINVVGISSDDMYFIWSITDYGLLSGKVSIDSNLGVVSVVKDIDYNKEYTFKVKARMIAKSTGEETGSGTVTVKIPKVSIVLSEDSKNVVKGTAARIGYEVKGLVPASDELRVTSTPSVRNTLLYMQDNFLNVSVGNDAKSGNFTLRLYLLNNSNINDTATVIISDEAISDDERNSMRNVEDLYMHFPVPNTTERNAPTHAEAVAGKKVKIDNFELNYSYDEARNRYKVQIGSNGSIYFYRKEAGSNIEWYLSNAAVETKAAFYAPTPLEGSFPDSLTKGTGNKTVEIVYKNRTIKYQRIDVDSTGKFVYTVYDEESSRYFQYMPGKKKWVYFTNENAALYATATSYDGTGSTNNIYDSNIAKKAIDGSMSTRWETVWDTDPQYMVVDLGTWMHVNTIDIHWENARAKDYEIQVSNDGTSWTTVQSIGVAAGASKDDEGIAINTTTRYIRMYGKTRLNGYGYSIYEFEVYAGNY